MISFDFSDVPVVVTGAGSGIGLAIAQAFHGAGARACFDLNWIQHFCKFQAMQNVKVRKLGQATSGSRSTNLSSVIG